MPSKAKAKAKAKSTNYKRKPKRIQDSIDRTLALGALQFKTQGVLLGAKVTTETRVLTVDPGHNVGMAWGSIIDGKGELKGSILRRYEHLEEVQATILEWNPNVVAIEDFNTSGQLSAPGKHTILVIGFVIGICHSQNIKWQLHTPQFRYPFLPAAKIHPLTKGHIIHEIDATAHCLGLMWKLIKEGKN